jgi:NADP-dependent 3-hydroxy acid dehydrogenase YdfG
MSASSLALGGRVFLVTGGGGAIGQPIVRALVRAGGKVAVVERKPDEASIAEAGALAVAADLSTAAGAEAMVQATLAKLGRVDGLVHTIGGFAMGKVHEADLATYERMFDLNVRTLFLAIRAVMPGFLAQKSGFVCGFASLPAWTGSAPGSGLYGAAKSAAATMLRSLDGDLAGTDIGVSIVYPMGVVDTPANRKDMPDADPNQWIDPEEIAQSILFAATRSPRGRITELPISPPRA